MRGPLWVSAHQKHKLTKARRKKDQKRKAGRRVENFFSSVLSSPAAPSRASPSRARTEHSIAIDGDAPLSPNSQVKNTNIEGSQGACRARTRPHNVMCVCACGRPSRVADCRRGGRDEDRIATQVLMGAMLASRLLFRLRLSWQQTQANVPNIGTPAHSKLRHSQGG